MSKSRSVAYPLNPSLQEPWSISPKAFIKSIQATIKCDAALLGVIAPDRPQPDEIINQHGFDTAPLGRWINAKPAIGDLSRTAGDGVVMNTAGQRGLPTWLSGTSSLVAQLTEPHAPHRHWLLVLGRKGKLFTDAEQEGALLLLRRWQCSFVAPTERGLSRVLLGHDDRLLVADLSLRELLLSQPSFVSELSAQLHAIASQRYPKLAEGQAHDFVIELGGHKRWVNFRWNSSLGAADAAHWYLELRPADDTDMPSVGTVSDDRVAAALAYLHDRYSESPSLNTLASHVGMSSFHFHRVFAKVVGVTSKQYATRRQFQMAKWFLRATRTPIGTIADRTGFASHGHFTSAFHRVLGAIPREYREEHS